MTADRILWDHGRQSADELVAHDVTIHLEQMSDGCYWIGLTRPSGETLNVNIVLQGAANRRQWLTCTVQDDSPYEQPWQWDQDEEHPA